MLIHVLGSGAGGGFPQWNCNCHNCSGLRKGTIKARARTQSSIAVSGDGTNWVLFNASPDVLKQFQDFPAMQPARAIRDTGMVGIILIDAQIDHTTGLLMLREGTVKREIYCTDVVKGDLTSGNPLMNILGHYCGVNHHPVPTDGTTFEIPGAANLKFTAVALKSAAPPYSPHRHDPHPGDTIGVLVEDTRNGKKLFYAPGLGEIEPHLPPLFEQADCIMVDGTFWTNTEMIDLGLMTKTARDIGHLPQSGPGGMMEVLSAYPKARRVLIHINNTNPILNEESPERRQLEATGIEVSYDGMEITL
ncbi:pyrroloquinoline quinone biosynthesis protein B [Novimethylophilus kurashikiensis]|uniref:Coenzyme PQQ synthesis protein B n=1 Tax=Novimethylophilus kurashikiensis TaxID=1825523 RepID=A0A2R5F7X4_9PROT|nr:pyrroloquinoline quinone biosynthesis protein PqqB [Novimethylophilus kurashikiensis]GBG12781.1 pyrroloquinoline quinone biosynthesis protein B [Novimethylophilus kurashikiensis]